MDLSLQIFADGVFLISAEDGCERFRVRSKEPDSFMYVDIMSGSTLHDVLNWMSSIANQITRIRLYKDVSDMSQSRDHAMYYSCEMFIPIWEREENL